jgi:hypothetical protein
MPPQIHLLSTETPEILNKIKTGTLNSFRKKPVSLETNILLKTLSMM